MRNIFITPLLRIAETLCLAVAVLIVCCVFLFQTVTEMIATSPYYRDLFMRLVEENTPPDMRMASPKLDWSWAGPGPRINLYDVHWESKEQTIFLRANEVRVRYDPLGHLWGSPTTRLEIIDGGLILRTDSGGTNPNTLKDLSLTGKIRNLSFITEEAGGLIFLVKEGDFIISNGRSEVHLRGAAHWQDLIAADLHVNVISDKGIYADLSNIDFRPGWQGFIGEVNLPTETRRDMQSIESLSGDGKLWIKELPQQEERQVFAKMNIRQLGIENKSRVTDLAFSSRWDYHLPSKDWQLWMNDLSGTLGEKKISLPATRIKKEGSVYLTKTARANLEELTHLAKEFLSGEELRRNLDIMDLRGAIADTTIRFDTLAPLSDSADRFSLHGQLHDVSLQPLDPAPGGHGISGYINISGNSGTLALDAAESGVFIPKTYPAPLVFDKAKGHFAWEWLPPNRLLLVGNATDIRHQNKRATMDLQLESIFAEHGYLDLLVGLFDANTQQAKSYIPWLLLNTTTQSWLDEALVKSEVDQAALLLKTDVRAPESSQNIFELTVHADDTVFLYDNTREALGTNETGLIMDGPELEVILPHGIESESEIKAQTAHVRMNTNTNVIGINGTGDLEASFLAGLINQYVLGLPISTNVNRNRETRPPLIAMQGNLTGAWDFDYHIRKQSLENLAFDTRFKLDSFYHPAIITAAKDIGGNFSFSKGRGFLGGLAGEYAGSPVTGRFVSQDKENYLRLNTVLSPADFASPQLTDAITGKTPVKIDIGTATKGDWRFNRLTVETDLSGVAMNLPAPLAKETGQRIPVKLELLASAQAEEQVINIEARKIATINLRRENQKAQKAQQIQELDASKETPAPAELSARIEAPLNLTAWREYLRTTGEQTIQPANAVDFIREQQEKWRAWDIRADRAELGGRHYRDLRIQLTPQKTLLFSIGKTNGRANFEQAGVGVQIEDVYINKTSSRQGQSGFRLPDHLSFEGMPKVNLVINRIVYDDLDVGSAATDISFTPTGMTAVLNTGNFLGLPLDAKINWNLLNATRSNVKIFSNAEGTLAPGRIPTMNADLVRLSTDLSWQGENQQFTKWLESAQGQVDLEAEDGDFPGTRSLLINNMLSLLNIANLGSRFRGDFRDVSANNMHFDELKIHLIVDDGLVTTNPDWDATFGFGNMRLEGNYSLKTKELDYLATVTPSVAQTLPLTALLLGASSALPLLLSLELSGGNDFFNRFSSANYRITGNITEPDIKLVRLGDISGQKFSPDDLSEKSLDIKSRLRNLSP